jgi:REP element-mobilizing transposase RayT
MTHDGYTKYDPRKHPFDHAQGRHRKSIRLQGYDYSQAGAYFITIVTQGREPLFGEIINGEMRLNPAGKIVQDEWERLSQRFKFIVLGIYVVMPNHFHAIIVFVDRVGATLQNITNANFGDVSSHTRAPDGMDGSPLRPHGPAPASLGAIIGQFKSRVTKRLWKIPALTGVPIWQRNYYEHIIRNEDDANRIHLYIESNPARWDDDNENPTRQS